MRGRRPAQTRLSTHWIGGVVLVSACNAFTGVDRFDFGNGGGSTGEGSPANAGSGATGSSAGGAGGEGAVATATQSSSVAGSGGSCVAGACAAGCAMEIAAGQDYTCAREINGTLWCWGDDTDGEIGSGMTAAPASTPVQVAALGASVVQIAAGTRHACALRSDGGLWCWGDNADGELGDGTAGSPQTTPVQVTALGTSVIAVAAGLGHTCAIKSDMTLWCWGHNVYGEVGDGTTTPRSSPMQVMALGANVVEVAAGYQHTCARLVDDTLWCWGDNTYGELGDATTTTKLSPVQVAALGMSAAGVAGGGGHTCALKADGTLWCWGLNDEGQIGDGTMGNSTSAPAQVMVLGGSIVQVAAGNLHTCARKVDGTLWCWGYNHDGELGDGTTISRVLPVQVKALGGSFVQVAAGASHTCAITADNAPACWGLDTAGELGDGSTASPQPSPVPASLACP